MVAVNAVSLCQLVCFYYPLNINLLLTDVEVNLLDLARDSYTKKDVVGF